MAEITTGFVEAFLMLSALNPELFGIIGRTFQVSLSALLFATLAGLSLAVWLALFRFRAKSLILILLHTLLGLPPVVVGLIVYILLSRSGPLGGLNLLFTVQAMVIAQFILIVPIIASYSHDILAESWRVHADQLRSLGANRAQSALVLIHDSRYSLLVVILGGFGRAISEVGAVIIVGGNILHHTRTMTTSITLATSKGDLSFALALGIILMTIALVVNFLVYQFRSQTRKP